MTSCAADLYSQVVTCLKRSQPDLVIVQTQNGVIVTGGFQVVIEGLIHDCFEIRLEISQRFPEVEPKLYETAGRIPRELDRHMYPGCDGLCCYGIWAEWLATGPRTIERFFVETIHDFFFSQYYYQAHPTYAEADRWPLGERSHGYQGIIEGCARILGVPETFDAIIAALGFVIYEDISRNTLCFCGSGRRFKRCHRSSLWQVKKTLDHTSIKAMLDALSPKD